MSIGGLLGGMMIADAISKSGKGDSEPKGIIKCGEAKIDKVKEYMASLSKEEREQYLKNAKAKALLKELGEEKYIEYLEKTKMDQIVEEAIEEMGADKYNELLLLKAKEKRIKELEAENKKLKEEKRPKRYIRRK